MSYATYTDIEARWHPLSEQERERADVLIQDASAILDALVTPDDTDSKAELMCAVCCNMVIRAMSAADSYGVSQESMTAGPYTQQWTYSNPSGDMYLTKLEKRLLGITSGYIGSIQAKVDGYYGANQ